MERSSPHCIRVDVQPAYLAHESNPDERHYVFSYTVTIHNLGTQPVRLLRRRWLIIDANGERREVHGDGVVGKQPLIEPGGHFRYTSGALINTPFGSMEGAYEMLGDDGSSFEAPIPAFTLAIPGTLH